MNITPRDPKLRRAIRDVVASEFVLGLERVLYLDREGQVRNVLYPSQGEDVLRRYRDEMLAAGELGAVVHIQISRSGRYTHVHVIETFDDGGVPAKYAMSSAPSQHLWVGPSEADLGRWDAIWGEEEPDED